MVINLARIKSFSIERSGKRPGASATAIVQNTTIFVPLEGIVNFEKESLRLKKEIDKLTREITQISKKLENENFLNKAPAAVVEEVKQRYATCSEKRQKLESTMDRITSLDTD
jgi:valyl-tRNA synthetase